MISFGIGWSFFNHYRLMKNKMFFQRLKKNEEDYKIYKSFQDKFQRTNFMKTKKFIKHHMIFFQAI